MKYIYIFQKDVATVMVWDWNNPLEWKIMSGCEILLDFDSQQAFIAGDEGCDQWPPFAVKRAAIFAKFLMFFIKNIIHVSENTILASYMSGEIEGGLT